METFVYLRNSEIAETVSHTRRGSENDDEESSSEQDGQDLDMSSLNDRIQQTNEIRQNAREGQKRQADQFLQNTLR
ncbi:unnamed protein product [Didymodactylos carnosus]|uniref:Uncharacterized protein n=1 Tax=Didymodactylos carnosus TaxID=1234261 RepID=A0A815VLL9_9BILA|nr:unnamed protein product [Didymodactylos carnosus]CAF4391461.1 unnamed protein product [Didymodactylos carnosus]